LQLQHATGPIPTNQHNDTKGINISSSTPSAIAALSTANSTSSGSIDRKDRSGRAHTNVSAEAQHCATTTAIAEALGSLSHDTIANVSNIIGGGNSNGMSQKALSNNHSNNNENLSRGYSMEWLENCLKSLETMDVVQSRELGIAPSSKAASELNKTPCSSITNSITNSINSITTTGTGSLFDSIGDRDGFDRQVLSLLRGGKAYVQVKQHLQNQFGRALTDAEKARVTFVTKTADHVGMPAHNSNHSNNNRSSSSNSNNSSSSSSTSSSAPMRLSGASVLAGLDLDLFDSKCGELDMNMRLSTSSTGSLGIDSIGISGIGMSMEDQWQQQGNSNSKHARVLSSGSAAAHVAAAHIMASNNSANAGQAQELQSSSTSNSTAVSASSSSFSSTTGTSSSAAVCDESGKNPAQPQQKQGALSPSSCCDSTSSLERNSFSMEAMRASLTATC